MPVKRLAKESYVDIARRVLPPNYVEGLEADPLGMDIFCAFAAMLELADCATNKGTQSYFLRPHSAQTDVPAQRSTKATGALKLRGEAFTSDSYQVLAGQILEAYRIDSFGDEEFLGRYVATGGTAGITQGAEVDLAIEAELSGYSGNLFADSVYFRFPSLGEREVPCAVAAVGPIAVLRRTVSAVDSSFVDDWSMDLIGRYVIVAPLDGDPGLASTPIPRRIIGVVGTDVQTEPQISLTDIGRSCFARVVELSALMSLSQPTAIAGGNSGMLDARAFDFGASRLNGEPDESLSARLESLDDKVSAPSIARIVDRILGPLGIAWKLLETGDPKGLGGFVWGLHPWDFGQFGELAPDVDLTVDVYSVRSAVWLSDAGQRHFFVIALSPAINFEMWAASRIYAEVKEAIAAGVGFRLMIDANL